MMNFNDEFLPIMAKLISSIGREVPRPMIEAYYEELKDLPAPAVLAAARKAVRKHQYHTLPTIGELRELATTAMYGDLPSAGDSWQLVRSAIARYGLSGKLRALETLPSIARRTAEVIGWRDLCDSTNADTLRAHFFRAHDTEIKREEHRRLLDPQLEAELNCVAASWALEHGPGSNAAIGGQRPALCGPTNPFPECREEREKAVAAVRAAQARERADACPADEWRRLRVHAERPPVSPADESRAKLLARLATVPPEIKAKALKDVQARLGRNAAPADFLGAMMAAIDALPHQEFTTKALKDVHALGGVPQPADLPGAVKAVLDAAAAGVPSGAASDPSPAGPQQPRTAAVALEPLESIPC